MLSGVDIDGGMGLPKEFRDSGQEFEVATADYVISKPRQVVHRLLPAFLLVLFPFQRSYLVRSCRLPHGRKCRYCTREAQALFSKTYQSVFAYLFLSSTLFGIPSILFSLPEALHLYFLRANLGLICLGKRLLLSCGPTSAPGRV